MGEAHAHPSTASIWSHQKWSLTFERHRCSWKKAELGGAGVSSNCGYKTLGIGAGHWGQETAISQKATCSPKLTICHTQQAPTPLASRQWATPLLPCVLAPREHPGSSAALSDVLRGQFLLTFRAHRTLTLRRVAYGSQNSWYYLNWTFMISETKSRSQYTDCQGHEKQRQTEELSQTRGDWGDRMTKCYGVPWTGSWNREDINRKTGDIQTTSGV